MLIRRAKSILVRLGMSARLMARISVIPTAAGLLAPGFVWRRRRCEGGGSCSSFGGRGYACRVQEMVVPGAKECLGVRWKSEEVLWGMIYCVLRVERCGIYN